MRFIICDFSGDELCANEEILPFGSTSAEALAALQRRFIEAVDQFDHDDRKRWLTISISPDNDPIVLPDRSNNE